MAERESFDELVIRLYALRRSEKVWMDKGVYRTNQDDQALALCRAEIRRVRRAMRIALDAPRQQKLF